MLFSMTIQAWNLVFLNPMTFHDFPGPVVTLNRIIIGSDRRPETKQGVEGKIARFRSGRLRDRVRNKDRRSEPDCRSEAINLGTC